ncbi:MAG: acylphosphatase [Acidobacteriota bacterium]|nr:acylphosphatase [Acidobacteriota bacterium]
MEQKQAKRWIVKGSVQGVGFRFFVQHKATALGLTGWARNLDDGNVEVYAAGPPSRLADLTAALQAGPKSADVQSVDERDETVENSSSFSIR